MMHRNGKTAKQQLRHSLLRDRETMLVVGGLAIEKCTTVASKIVPGGTVLCYVDPCNSWSS